MNQDTNTISETVSEKPKRGRPRALAAWEEAMMHREFPVMTHRGRQNQAYFYRAMSTLLLRDESDSTFHWLGNTRLAKAGRGEGFRKTIMQELGRIDDEDFMREVAKIICDQKPSTRRAVAIARDCRKGDHSHGDAMKLADILIGAINRYTTTHLHTTVEQIIAALDAAKYAFLEDETACKQEAVKEA